MEQNLQIKHELTLKYLKDQEIENEKNKSKGELSLLKYREPTPLYELPKQLKQFDTINYDIQKYDFHKILRQILDIQDQKIKLEEYSSKQNLFSYKFQKQNRDKIGNCQELKVLYTKFMQEVIGPHILNNLNSQIKIDNEKNNSNIPLETQIMYQWPPTLRIHPPSKVARSLGKLHRDAEFGHQKGELNFWLALTDSSGGRSLWCESEPGKKDYQPFVLNYGQVRRFWGCQLKHASGVNETDQTRMSFDFRVAPYCTFDKDWKLPDIFYQHDWQHMVINLDNKNDDSQNIQNNNNKIQNKNDNIIQQQQEEELNVLDEKQINIQNLQCGDSNNQQIDNYLNKNKNKINDILVNDSNLNNKEQKNCEIKE